jgi:hypothetical protein
MLLSEMVRQIKQELQLVADATQRSTTSTTYSTLASYNITLSNPALLAYKYELETNNTGVYVYVRLNIGTLNIGGHSTGSSLSFVPFGGLFSLPAGSYTVNLQAKSSGNGAAIVKNFFLGVVSFADLSTVNLRAAGSSSISLASRKTCVGSLKQAILYISAHNSTAPTLTVDGNTKSWTLTEGECFTYISPATLDASHTVNVNAGSYAAVLSPWILSNVDTQVLNLNFPQGSTLYHVLEPLWLDPTKALKIGQKRAVSFGDSTDYYYTASGTGILNASYTFESVSVSNCVLVVSGYGGCISIIAVDVR